MHWYLLAVFNPGAALWEDSPARDGSYSLSEGRQLSLHGFDSLGPDEPKVDSLCKSLARGIVDYMSAVRVLGLAPAQGRACAGEQVGGGGSGEPC